MHGWDNVCDVAGEGILVLGCDEYQGVLDYSASVITLVSNQLCVALDFSNTR